MEHVGLPSPQQVFLSRYFNAIGISILIYDHLLSMDDEVEYIWNARMSAPKIAFLLVRYAMPAVLFVNTYQQSYDNVSLPQTFCKIWFHVAAVLFIIVVGIENFLILLRVWVLSDRKRKVMKWTSLFYLIMQAMTMGWTIAIMVKAAGALDFVGEKQAHMVLCSTKSRSIVPALYIPPVFFEAVMLVLILWSTYLRSRNVENRSVIHYLLNDGFIYILLLFVFRVANMLVTASAPAPLIFTGLCFGCATGAATVSRLILSLRKESVIKRRLAAAGHCPMDGLSLTASAMDGNCETAARDSWSSKVKNYDSPGNR